jgi:hypothetical protein
MHTLIDFIFIPVKLEDGVGHLEIFDGDCLNVELQADYIYSRLPCVMYDLYTSNVMSVN